MKKFFKALFNDNNSINEKSVIGFMSFLIMIFFAATDIVTGILGKGLLVNEFIFDAFLYLTLGCFGIASIDKWINKKSEDSKQQNNQDNEPFDGAYVD